MKAENQEPARSSASALVAWAFFAPLLIAMISWCAWRFTGVYLLATVAQLALGVLVLMVLGLVVAALCLRGAPRK